MTKKNFMVTPMFKFAITAMIALAFALVCTSSTAYAKKRVKYGTLEFSTTPAGMPISIDGRPEGTTTTDVRILQLEPGHHTVEITLPNGGRWVREFEIERARRLCLNLNFIPKKYTVTTSPCPYPVIVSSPPTVNDGDLITFAADVSYSGTAPLNYTWTVSPAEARVVSGVGTPTITVDSTGLGNQRVTAVLVVDDGSGEPACRQTAQASTNVTRKIVTGLNAACSISFRRLLSMTRKLVSTIWRSSCKTIRTSRLTSSSMPAARAAWVRPMHSAGARWTTWSMSVAWIQRRINMINGGYREEDYIEIWVCPPGAKAPQPSPTVQPGDAQPSGERTRPRRPRRPRG